MGLIIDVRTREEYYLNHIKGALNIPVWDLEFYCDFLAEKDVILYCGTRGKRAQMGEEYLTARGISATIMDTDALDEYEWVGKPMVTAINYLSVKPGHEDEVEQMMDDLCQFTMDKEGFIGTKVVRVTNVAYGGSMLRGEYEDIPIRPTKYIMITYWDTRASHESFHQLEEIVAGFMEMMPHLSVMPFEEYAEVLH